MVNPTVFFDIAVDGEPLGRVSFEVGAGGDAPGGPERSAGGEAELPGAGTLLEERGRRGAIS